LETTVLRDLFSFLPALLERITSRLVCTTLANARLVMQDSTAPLLA